MNIIEFIEKNLGAIKGSWFLPELKEVQVIKFENQPFDGIITYSTLGLSNYELDLSGSKKVKQELIFSIAEGIYDDSEVASFILTFAKHVIETRKALRRGELIGPGDQLFSNTASTSVYCSIPVFFGDEFTILETRPVNTVIVWLIPLIEKDAHFIISNGWQEFENLLEKTNTELFWNPDLSLL